MDEGLCIFYQLYVLVHLITYTRIEYFVQCTHKLLHSPAFWLHVPTLTYKYLHSLTCTYTHLHVPTLTYMYLHSPTSTYTHLHVPTLTYKYLHSSTCTYTHLHVPTLTYMYLHSPTCTYTHLQVPKLTYMYLHSPTCTYTHHHCIVTERNQLTVSRFSSFIKNFRKHA